MRILTAAEMGAVDRRAIEELGIPGMVLMENAAVGVADALGTHFPEADSVVVLCGPGNNGGDGLALARHLEARGYRYRVFLVADRPLAGDAASQLAILENAGIEVEPVTSATDLKPILTVCRGVDLVVDALFGTGLSRPLSGPFLRLVQGLDRMTVPKLAVDLPSGLDGSRAEPPGPHLAADLTVTFAAPKVAHVLPPAARAIGELVVTDLGIPPGLVDEAPGDLHLLTSAELAAGLRVPEPDAHKGDFGHVLLIAGSPGKAGAAILAAQAAVRGGAGLVTAAVPEPIQSTVDGASLESMTLALDADPEGGLLTPEAVPQALAAAVGKAVVAIGPGLGQSEPTFAAIRHLARELETPLILDADGLNALARPEHLTDLAQRSAATVLTPHPGEMARLLGITSREVQADRLGAARRAARDSGALVVLKGHRTVIAEPDNALYINPTGNAGMATGGSGDVLTGLTAAAIGQGYEPLAAVQLAVYLHGLAGDLAIETQAPETLRAGDLIEALPSAFQRLRAA